MASFDGDPFGGESFSQLLDSNSSVMGLEMADHYAAYSPSFTSGNYLSMLCFENHGGDGEKVGVGETGGASRRKYGMMISASDSSSGSSSNNNSSSSSSVVTKSKKTQSGEERRELLTFPRSSDSNATVENRKVCNTNLKVEKPSSTTGPGKGRKEKIGERITALQQLVSPFGKTDTASVLHEAMGYIRFLHDQVQVLGSPYMQGLPSSERLIKDGREDEEKEGIIRQDLRSRGLCLVPVSSTAYVANSNGADLWSPAMGSTSSKN